MTGELQTYSLDRTGGPPLAFEGEFLAGAYGSDYIGEKARGRNPRWHDLEVYRLKDITHVLHIRYRTEWEDRAGDGEVGFDEARHFTSPEALVEYLREYDPTARVEGYPDGARFARKQRRLLGEIGARYDACVGDLLGQLGPDFAERIP